MNIKTGSYLPFNMTALGILLILSSPFVFQIRPVVAVVFLVVGVVLSTIHRRLKIDLNQKYYHEFVWILGYKSGEKKSFEVIECIYITSSREAQQFGFSVRTQHLSQRYNSYVKFGRSDKAFMAESISKHELMRKVDKIGLMLNVMIEDYS